MAKIEPVTKRTQKANKRAFEDYILSKIGVKTIEQRNRWLRRLEAQNLIAFPTPPKVTK